MLMITSERQIKELIKRGRKERSDALFQAISWLMLVVRPNKGTAQQKEAALKQCCPN